MKAALEHWLEKPGLCIRAKAGVSSRYRGRVLESTRQRERFSALIRVVPRITPSSLGRDKGVFLYHKTGKGKYRRGQILLRANTAKVSNAAYELNTE
jgi:hypothetical protein